MPIAHPHHKLWQPKNISRFALESKIAPSWEPDRVRKKKFSKRKWKYDGQKIVSLKIKKKSSISYTILESLDFDSGDSGELLGRMAIDSDLSY